MVNRWLFISKCIDLKFARSLCYQIILVDEFLHKRSLLILKMKLSSYAKQVGVSYKTAHRWWKAGQISGYQLPTGTIVITEGTDKSKDNIACIYARVDSESERQQLEDRVAKLKNYAIAKEYHIYKVYREVASGFDDRRKYLIQALKDNNYNILLVEDRDNLAKNGINYLNVLLEMNNKKLEFADFSSSNAPTYT